MLMTTNQRVEGYRGQGETRGKEILMTLRALAALFLTTTTLRIYGFKRLHNMVKDWPIGKISPVAVELQSETDLVCRSIKRAMTYSLMPLQCLRQSAATVCLLRTRGIGASLVIGITRFPFTAHAWAEVEGRIVDGPPQLREFYKEIERM